MESIVGFGRKFVRKGFAVNTFDAIMDSSGGVMKRSLRGWQLLLLGVGTMVSKGGQRTPHSGKLQARAVLTHSAVIMTHIASAAALPCRSAQVGLRA